MIKELESIAAIRPKGLQTSCINAKRHLWLENDFSFVTSFNEWWQINFDVARALSSLPQNLHHLARGLCSSDVDGWSESSLSVVAGALQLSRMILDENSSSEGISSFWWISVTIFVLNRHDISDLGHVFLWKSLDVNSDVVSWSCLCH